jgi:hypothetical protein
VGWAAGVGRLARGWAHKVRKALSAAKIKAFKGMSKTSRKPPL